MNRLQDRINAFVADKNLDDSQIKFIEQDTENWYNVSMTDEDVDTLIEFSYKTITADFVCGRTEVIELDGSIRRVK